MDATVEKIFFSKSQWRKAVNGAFPDFFEQSAKGQSPKVRVSSFLSMYSSSGLDAQTRVSPRPSSPLRDRAISCVIPSSTIPLPNSFPSVLTRIYVMYSQVHPDDDSVLSVVTFAVVAVGVEHSTFLPFTIPHPHLTERLEPYRSSRCRPYELQWCHRISQRGQYSAE
jgi:hypothetical protein